jgi:hypothetical protein
VQDTMDQCLAIHFSDTRTYSMLLPAKPLIEVQFWNG